MRKTQCQQFHTKNVKHNLSQEQSLPRIKKHFWTPPVQIFHKLLFYCKSELTFSLPTSMNKYKFSSQKRCKQNHVTLYFTKTNICTNEVNKVQPESKSSFQIKYKVKAIEVGWSEMNYKHVAFLMFVLPQTQQGTLP